MTLRGMTVSAAMCSCLAIASLSCEEPEQPVEEGQSSEGIGPKASATLRDASGNAVATVIFTGAGGGVTKVTVTAKLSPEQAGIHGFHVHANDNAANGDGCVADPAQPASTHFVSADGHFNPGGAVHGDHAGDMPSLFIGESGTGTLIFATDRFTPAQVKGRAVILHQLRDNFNNVPQGAATNQYTANSADAVTLTDNTGNAGARIACGVVQ